MTDPTPMRNTVPRERTDGSRGCAGQRPLRLGPSGSSGSGRSRPHGRRGGVVSQPPLPSRPPSRPNTMQCLDGNLAERGRESLSGAIAKDEQHARQSLWASDIALSMWKENERSRYARLEGRPERIAETGRNMILHDYTNSRSASYVLISGI